VPDSSQGPRLVEIDSLGREEAASPIPTLSPICNPRRPWALWSSIPVDPNNPRIFAYSHGRTSIDSVAGSLSITQYAPAVGGGAIISGRYLFRAQRADLYTDPLGVLTIRGTFVAPLQEQHTTCQG